MFSRRTKSVFLVLTGIFITFSSFLLMSHNVSAASLFNYNYRYRINNDNFDSGWVLFPTNTSTGSLAFSIPSISNQGGSNWKNTKLWFQAPNTPPTSEYFTNADFTITFSMVLLSPYSSNTTPSGRALSASCPLVDSRFTQNDCQVDSVEVVYGDNHYTIYNFVLTGTIVDASSDANLFWVNLDIVNLSPSSGTIYLYPARASFGRGSYSVIREILANEQQTNAYLQNISNAFSNSNAYLQAIQSLSQQILNKMDSSNVSGVVSELEKVNDHNDKEEDAAEDIADQTTNDIQGATNQQTTSLISTLSNFVSAISSVNATNCVVQLDFPVFAGGSQTVDLCTVKADSNNSVLPIITTFSSVSAIVMFLPMTVMLIKMIFNEIRSWTNG